MKNKKWEGSQTYLYVLSVKKYARYFKQQNLTFSYEHINIFIVVVYIIVCKKH